MVIVKYIVTAIMIIFCTAAIFYSTLLPDSLRIALTILFPFVLIASAFIKRGNVRLLTFLFFLTIFWIWYFTDPPRNDRDWSEEYAVPADVLLDGSIAHIRHIRNFAWKSENDFTPAWYDAEYDIKTLSGVDLITSYWAGESIAHVFLSFAFRDGRHLAVSIETRRQKRFPYSAIAGFFHHYELFYVVADERDLIGVRTDFRKERVYLFPLMLSPETEKRLFTSYVQKIHALNTRPEWYNTLLDNCTTGILARAQARWQYRLDWRVLLSGYTASLAYDMGFLDHSHDFQTLKRLSRIWRPAGAVPDANFSEEIRERLKR